MNKTIEGLTYDFEGDVFVDVGGNIGMWTTQLVDAYDKVIFVEPSTAALTEAQKRISAVCQQKGIDVSKVEYKKNICSNVLDHSTNIYATTMDTGNFSVFAKDLYGDHNVTMQEESIPTITLDSLIPSIGDDKSVLLKVDTEGSDLNVLLGGFEFIKKYKPTVFMETHYHMYFDQEKHDQVYKHFKDLGYSILEMKDPAYLQKPNTVIDHKHTGKEMYDLHYKVLFEHPENGHLSHFYEKIDGWFSYEYIYKHIVDTAEDGEHFVEVGSFKGRSTSFMAVEILNSGKDIKFDAIDTWKGSPEHQAGGGSEVKEVVEGTLFETFMANIEPVKNYVNPIRMPSLEAAKLYEDGSLNFVMIDGDHGYEAVKADILAWLPKVKSGGVIAGDDAWAEEVKRAAQETLGQFGVQFPGTHFYAVINK